ncbi:hypothetical protein [Staphylococcus hominis]
MLIRAIKAFIKGSKQGIKEAKENPDKFEYGLSKEELRRKKHRQKRADNNKIKKL